MFDVKLWRAGLAGAMVSVLLGATPIWAEVTPEKFEEAYVKAVEMGETPQGKVFEKGASNKLGPPMQAALRNLSLEGIELGEVKLILEIGRDGTVTSVFPKPGNKISAAVAAKVKDLKLPAPPVGGWLMGVKITVKE